MKTSNEEFKEKILNKYIQDINNIYMIQDYITLESIKECENMISEISKENNDIMKEEKGAFTFLIDKKYVLIAKNEELKNIFGLIYYYLLSLSKDIHKSESLILSNIKEIISLINLILIFNDNVTFYSLKKKILSLALKNEMRDINEIVLSEYYFTCTKNKKCRKSLISWDYKYFLYHNFFKDNNKQIIINQDSNNKFSIFNLLKDELKLLEIKENIFHNNDFILKDFEILDVINNLQSRNYHMWTYLRKVFNDINNEGKILILLYAFYLLRKCSFDYSAFCFIVNSKNNFPLNSQQLKLIIEDIKKTNIIKYDEHKNYINDIEKFSFS